MSRRNLFGGAIVIDIPDRFQDISEVREVPDNQEVFVDITTDESLIVELVEHDASIADSECTSHFLSDLAQLNSATAAEVVESGPHPALPLLPAASSTFAAVGRQTVAKFKESATNVINVYLAVARLPANGTDILVSLNSPVSLNPASSSAQTASHLPVQESARQVLLSAFRSLSVVDFSLFGGGEEEEEMK